MKSLKPSLVLFLIALILRSSSLILASRLLGLTFEQIASFQDGPSYLYLATHWPIYPESGLVIHFPFYPLVIALFALFMPSVEISGLIVSLLAGSFAVAEPAARKRFLTCDDRVEVADLVVGRNRLGTWHRNFGGLPTQTFTPIGGCRWIRGR